MADSPLIWIGGKTLITDWLLEYTPPHEQYLELFGGGAALLFAKPAAKLETYNDLNSGLVNFFRQLRDNHEALVAYLDLIPYSREEYTTALKSWEDEPDDMKRAALWWSIVRQSFSGKFDKGWGYSVMENRTNSYLNAIDRFPQFHRRLRGVQIEHLDWADCLTRYALSPTCFVYADPPYIMQDRGTKQDYYRHEFTAKDHAKLAQALAESPAMVLLSGYPDSQGLYQPLMDKGWTTVEKEVVAYSAGAVRSTPRAKGEGGRSHFKRTEVLWMNPALMQARLPLLSLIT